jgi:hypothetical protein
MTKAVLTHSLKLLEGHLVQTALVVLNTSVNVITAHDFLRLSTNAGTGTTTKGSGPATDRSSVSTALKRTRPAERSSVGDRRVRVGTGTVGRNGRSVLRGTWSGDYSVVDKDLTALRQRLSLLLELLVLLRVNELTNGKSGTCTNTGCAGRLSVIMVVLLRVVVVLLRVVDTTVQDTVGTVSVVGRHR